MINTEILDIKNSLNNVVDSNSNEVICQIPKDNNKINLIENLKNNLNILNEFYAKLDNKFF